MASKKVALITGCTSGVGKALAFAMARTNRYVVYATGRSSSKLDAAKEQAAAELSKESARDLKFVTLDVASDESVDSAVKTILDAEGRVDILVNNAGYSQFGPIELMPMEDCKKQFETNFFGVIRMIKAVGPSMRKQKGGVVLSVSSVGGVWGQPMNDVYCASKFALEGLIESMAPTYAEFGIKFSLIEPGAISTDFTSNAQLPDVTNIEQDFQEPIKKVTDFYRNRASNGTSKSQTGDEVAKHCLDIIESANPAIRYQCNPSIDAVFKMKLNDLDGSKSFALARRNFFSDPAASNS